jgi:GNAT superfamily N-acetyltransferase
MNNTPIQIREFSAVAIDSLVLAFARHNWEKPKELFHAYLQEQKDGKRKLWVAYYEGELAGYVTLNGASQYQPFLAQGIPEIMDLNVLPPFRCKGIGSKLLDEAEKSAAKKSPIVGIGVGLYDGYGDAQKLYVKRGYVPDGYGPTYNYSYLAYGQSVTVDDDLVLWFTKQL